MRLRNTEYPKKGKIIVETTKGPVANSNVLAYLFLRTYSSVLCVVADDNFCFCQEDDDDAHHGDTTGYVVLYKKKHQDNGRSENVSR